jgi:hypothetical protein
MQYVEKYFRIKIAKKDGPTLIECKAFLQLEA